MKRVKGLHEYRFKQNPEEKRFADAWAERNQLGNNLAHLLDTRPVQTGHPPTPSDRDFEVAATVIQWLGTHVGMCFLRDLGYEKGVPDDATMNGGHQCQDKPGDPREGRRSKNVTPSNARRKTRRSIGNAR